MGALRARVDRRGLRRDTPPLIAVALVLIGLLALLPSALNLPQTNPTQTLEFAPVPPDDQSAPPAAGNLSGLGLGSSSSISGANGQSSFPDSNAGRSVKLPGTKRCVGNPPRQTEDPFSPPCVASFNGDNGGSTYQGVTSDEVRILMYVDSSYSDVGGDGAVARPTAKLYDLEKPPDPDETESYHVRAGRIWQRYFNDRYQAYGRFVHFYVYFSRQLTTASSNAEARRADAVDNYAQSSRLL